MVESPQFCLACFRRVPAESLCCPACGADLAALSARGYRENLLHALEHPLAEVRMRAIIACGWRGEACAAQPLYELALRHPVDVVEGLAVVASLRRLGAEGRAMLDELAEVHPAHAVRAAAGDLE
jgi:HEAT repeat protein